MKAIANSGQIILPPLARCFLRKYQKREAITAPIIFLFIKKGDDKKFDEPLTPDLKYFIALCLFV
jgi:hypothetical protein